MSCTSADDKAHFRLRRVDSCSTITYIPFHNQVHLEVSLPDEPGRRDILRIHTRAMRANGMLSADAEALIEGRSGSGGLPARTEHFSGAELAGVGLHLVQMQG